MASSVVFNLINFFPLFRPSVHQSFDKNEDSLRIIYEEAEKMGASGADCDLMYPNCANSFLSDISNFVVGEDF